MNKTAKGMFEKLGYELINENPFLWYQMIDGSNIDTIIFNQIVKQVIITSTYDNENHEKCLCIQELQAINKQIEELGWNE